VRAQNSDSIKGCLKLAECSLNVATADLRKEARTPRPADIKFFLKNATWLWVGEAASFRNDEFLMPQLISKIRETAKEEDAAMKERAGFDAIDLMWAAFYRCAP